jgi:hypothetical protein
MPESRRLTTILLIAPETTGEPVAAALAQHLDLAVEHVINRRYGMSRLRRHEYSLILIEEALAATDPEATDLLYKAASGTPVLEINFVLSNAARIVRQVRAALTRRAQDRTHAHTAVASRLHGELNNTLAALLLESELALRNATPDQQPKLRSVVELASGLRERLRA